MAKQRPGRRTARTARHRIRSRQVTLPGTSAAEPEAHGGRQSLATPVRDVCPCTRPAKTNKNWIHPFSSHHPAIHASPAWRIPASLPPQAVYSPVLPASAASPDTAGPRGTAASASEDKGASFEDSDGTAYGRTCSSYQTPAYNRTASASSGWPPPSQVGKAHASAAYPFPA